MEVNSGNTRINPFKNPNFGLSHKLASDLAILVGEVKSIPIDNYQIPETTLVETLYTKAPNPSYPDNYNFFGEEIFQIGKKGENSGELGI